MPLYRAKHAGQHPDKSAKRIREGETFEWAGTPGAWMELVEQASPAPSEPEPTPEPIAEPESAPVAEPKRKARKGAE